MTALERACADADTEIFIVTNDTKLCAEMLKLLRAPNALSPAAVAMFEAHWTVYRETFAARGGVLGALLHPRLRQRGPMLAMGEAGQVATIAKVLSLKAREITHRKWTPLMVETAFEPIVGAVIADLTAFEGCA